jgi:spore coat protein CotF
MSGYKQKNQLNEKVALQDMLATEKEVVKMYSTALTESSTSKVRSIFKSSWQDAVADQYGVFTLMSELGYYEPAPADKTVIDKQKDNFKKVANSLS